MTDAVRIMGGGPAGLTAAITLARRGRAVTVYEKNRDCGARFRGDLQGLENWTSKLDTLAELESMGIDVNFDCKSYDRTHGITDQGDVVRFDLDAPLFYLVRRGVRAGSLDQGLKQQALALGVDISFETRVKPSDVDIVACGPSPKEIYAIDIGIVFETDMEDAIYAMADDNSSYKGYSYLLVMNGYGCMCTVLFDRFPEIRKQFARARATFIEMTGVTIKNPTDVGGYGSFSRRGPYVRDGRPYCGEAAGLQDLVWGFGIRYALRSGRLAANCLVDGRDYSAAAQEMFGDSLKAGIVNRCVWEHLGNRGYRFFMKQGQKARNQRGFLFDFSQFGLSRRIAFPLALWDLQRRHPSHRY